jgi:glutathione S-transferase
VLELYGPDSKATLLAVSPSGLVPVLKVDGEVIGDSLAIAEWAAEHYPQANLWPAAGPARWLARSAAAEMHAGFGSLRQHCTMNPDHPMVGPARSAPPNDPGVTRDLQRLVTLWTSLRQRFGEGGPYLFGDWSIADAFFTPVAARVRHYQIALVDYGDAEGIAAQYVESLLAQPDFVLWSEQALK